MRKIKFRAFFKADERIYEVTSTAWKFTREILLI